MIIKNIQVLFFTLTIGFVLSSVADARGDRYGSSDPATPLAIMTLERGTVAFEQVTFDLEIGTIAESDWGQFRVRLDHLIDRRGKPVGPGYVNVFFYPDSGSEAGTPVWAVDNLFVPGSAVKMGKTHGKKTHTADNYYHVWAADGRGGNQWGSHEWGKEDGRKHGGSRSVPAVSRRADATVYFDLRPGTDGEGSVQQVRATVLFSSQPLPNITDIVQFANQFSPQMYPVRTTVVKAEGAGHVDGRVSPVSSTIPNTLSLGRPPQPALPAPSLPDDLSFPIQVVQSDQPNLDSARNQCVPIANANALQYLEDRYDNVPLAWRVPQLHIRGIGQIGAAGDVLTWTPVPENSLVANIDSYGRRDNVHDLNTGSYTTFCGLIRGLFGYLADSASGSLDVVHFRHQGSSSVVLGDNADCDNGTVLMSDITSQQEGNFPTWEWMFNELSQGRAVTILFSWYDINGEWKGGHSVRVYGAALINNKHYIMTLDDGEQGDNFSNVSDPRTQQWEVADTGRPGLDGVPDGRLNMNGMSWEIDFALSFEAKPTLLIP
ncbi:hypothetical protein L6J37_11770 [Photobacterium sp. WH77]|uniref:hypothetical protein n=1 Tax=unclassified Photobacterium TaxID=2628852 RepID=UPI001C44F93C|nr:MULTISPECIES: hypothetical protein [unclassified Photobacterium]MBV7264177.1 hypothetical protein [Photobacterium sp. WH24]MCG2837507.1 hypothetical protein [Photobacterium sp. WH77]MCG2845123.1 hypothetical protein [Photobacterium sp. WH80]